MSVLLPQREGDMFGKAWGLVKESVTSFIEDEALSRGAAIAFYHRNLNRPGFAHRRCDRRPRLRPGCCSRRNRGPAQRSHGTAERGAAANRPPGCRGQILRHLGQRRGSDHAADHGVRGVRRNAVGPECHLESGAEGRRPSLA